jgi:hypothetical protein
MTPFDQTEFEALRATIRERGTARVVLFYVGMAVWAALTVATTAVIVLPVAALLPLLVLAAGFEATAALQAGAGWETAAMGMGTTGRGKGPDPTFSVVYILAGFGNFLPVALTAQMREEMIAIGAFHALFVWRVLTVRRAMGLQRERELTAFRGIVRNAESAEKEVNAEKP